MKKPHKHRMVRSLQERRLAEKTISAPAALGRRVEMVTVVKDMCGCGATRFTELDRTGAFVTGSVWLPVGGGGLMLKGRPTTGPAPTMQDADSGARPLAPWPAGIGAPARHKWEREP
jgi:hypothetical protein